MTVRLDACNKDGKVDLNSRISTTTCRGNDQSSVNVMENWSLARVGSEFKSFRPPAILELIVLMTSLPAPSLRSSRMGINIVCKMVSN